jgi:hypothetical protein
LLGLPNRFEYEVLLFTIHAGYPDFATSRTFVVKFTYLLYNECLEKDQTKVAITMKKQSE